MQRPISVGDTSWRFEAPGDVTGTNEAGITADVIWVGVAGM
jgi:hypothetical protein